MGCKGRHTDEYYQKVVEAAVRTDISKAARLFKIPKSSVFLILKRFEGVSARRLEIRRLSDVKLSAISDVDAADVKDDRDLTIAALAGELLEMRNKLKTILRGLNCSGHHRPDLEQYRADLRSLY